MIMENFHLNILDRMEMVRCGHGESHFVFTEWKLVLRKYFANMSILAILPDVDSAEE